VVATVASAAAAAAAAAAGGDDGGLDGSFGGPDTPAKEGGCAIV